MNSLKGHRHFTASRPPVGSSILALGGLWILEAMQDFDVRAVAGAQSGAQRVLQHHVVKLPGVGPSSASRR